MIKSTKTSLKAFIDESLIWQDMLAEMSVWEAMIRSEIDECSDLRGLGNIQGRLEALSYLRRLPSFLLGAVSAEPTSSENEEVNEDSEE